MKKVATVFGILFAVFLVCFMASVAATGVGDEGFRVSVYGLNGGLRLGGISTKTYQAGEEYIANLAESETVKRIDLGIAAARTTVKVEDTDMIGVYYKAGRSGIRFGCEIRNGTLIVREDAFFWTFFDFGGDPSELELILPAREYEKIVLSAASGEIKADDLVCEKFSAEVASGSGDFTLYAREIDLDAASGKIVIGNCSPEKPPVKSINIDCASGSHTVRGFAAEKFDVDLASGNVTLEDISGKGDIDLASGVVKLVYADWNDDLTVDATSGTVEVLLPAGSGAWVECDAASGGVTSMLDNDSHYFSRDGNGYVGGENRHRVDVDIASGEVRLANRADEIKPEPQENPPSEESDDVPPDEAAE
ncbi:MAG: DUF4097 domain-containing protein [Bacteroides sp.]|nr:DUF4097 domain-containing protein [Eubacterium sp.]MCM1419503.1 DUF4097 domain-containing protein [Roseburia sp.]MCM1463272.1 DUF4097 domain-containing protein [Bacteroides sp.]